MHASAGVDEACPDCSDGIDDPADEALPDDSAGGRGGVFAKTLISSMEFTLPRESAALLSTFPTIIGVNFSAPAIAPFMMVDEIRLRKP